MTTAAPQFGEDASSSGVVEPGTDPGLDGILQLLAAAIGVATEQVGIVCADRAWFKLRYRLSATTPCRDGAFCRRIFATRQCLLVPDASQDPRFASEDSVTGARQLRFFAGAPLLTPAGHVLGALFAHDSASRHEQQAIDMLQLAAAQVMAQLELGRSQRSLTEDRGVIETHRQFFELTPELLCTIEENFHFRELSPAWEATLGWSRGELRGQSFLGFVHPADLVRTEDMARRLLEYGEISRNFDMRCLHRSGEWVPLSWSWKAQGSIIYAAAHDMTSYRAKENALVNAHGELREREANLRALFEAMADGVLQVNGKGIVTASNAAAETIFNMPRGGLLGRAILDDAPMDIVRQDGTLMPLEERAGRLALHQGQASSGQIMGMPTAPGQLTWISLNASPLWGQEPSPSSVPRGVVMTFRDITIDRIMQATLEQSEANFRDLVTSMPVGVSVVRDGTVRYVNANLLKTLDYADDSLLLDRDVLNLFLPSSLDRASELFSTLASPRRTEPEVLECRGFGGTPRLLEITTIPTLYDSMQSTLVLARDVTESHRARLAQQRSELQLAKSEATFRTLAQRSSIGIGVRVDGQLKYANPALARMHGLSSPEELLSRLQIDLMRPGSHGAWQERLAALAQGHDVAKQIFAFGSSDTDATLLEFDSIFIEHDGQPAVMSLVRDVTELERAHRDRNAAHAALLESLGQKETLLKEIHHRVKNNLQVIASLLRLGKHYVADSAALGVFSDSIARVHSIALIHERLYQTKDLNRVDVRNYLSGLVGEIARAHIDSRRPVQLYVTSADVHLDMDRCVPIGLIVNELVTIALKHAFHAPVVAPCVRVELAARDDGYELTVRDNGSGQPTSGSGPATQSLGLVLVSSLTRQLEGTTHVSHDNGTAFSISFPKQPQAEA